MKPISTVVGGILVSFISAYALAEAPQADRTFATNAAASGLGEVSLGQLAKENAGSPAIRQLGQQMVTDHTRANQELVQIGKQQNLNLPTKPDATDIATEQQLSTSKGGAFDTSYVQEMVQSHQKAVAAFQHEAESGEDPALKAFAQKYLPILQHHLQMVQAIKLPAP